MGRMAVFFLSVLLCANAVLAATLNIGGKAIQYQIPSGFVSVEGDPELEEVLRVTKQLMPPDQEILAMYVASSALKRFAREGLLDRYMLITTSRQLKRRDMGARDAREMKQALKKGFASFDDPDVMDRLNDTLSDLTDGSVRLQGAKILGWYAETAAGISCVALLTAQSSIPGESGISSLAMVSTNFITGGRFITINQYKTASSPEEVAAFKDEAQAVIQEMAFPQDLTRSLLEMLGADSLVGRMVLGGVAGGLIAAVVAVFGKKRKERQALRNMDEGARK